MPPALLPALLTFVVVVTPRGAGLGEAAVVLVGGDGVPRLALGVEVATCWLLLGLDPGPTGYGILPGMLQLELLLLCPGSGGGRGTVSL